MATAGKGTTPELLLLRLLASTDLQRAREQQQLDDLVTRCDPTALLEHAGKLRLTGLLELRLGEKFAAWPAATVQAPLARYRAAAQRESVRHQLVAMGALGALARAQIRAVPVKGSFWSRWLYGDSATRVSADIDLLVLPENLEQAVDVLVEAGYQRPHDVRRSDGLPYLHHTLGHPTAQDIELHWRLHWFASEWSREAWTTAEPDPEGVLRLTAENELAAALVFSARDGFRGLRYLADVAAIWDTRAAELPPGGLEGLVDRHPELRRTLATAAVIAERHVGVPYHGLLADRHRRDVSALAVRLADWPLAVAPAQGKGDVNLVDGLLTPRRYAGEYVRRAIVPPSESFVHHHPELAGAPVRTALKQGEHATRTAGRFLRALVLPRPS
jgi:hypothetical protein